MIELAGKLHETDEDDQWDARGEAADEDDRMAVTNLSAAMRRMRLRMQARAATNSETGK